MLTQYYTAYGLTIASYLPLDELTPTIPSTADLVITAGPVHWPACKFSSDWFQCETRPDGLTYLSWQQVGAFEIAADGSQIIVDAAVDVEPALLRLPLLGTVLALALRNQGLLILHASAVEIDGAAAVFLGRSGAGKSTMTAVMHKRGHPAIADDVVALQVPIDGCGSVSVLRGIDRCKLWPDSVSAVGCHVDELLPLHSKVDKLNVPLHQRRSVQSRLPLGSLYLLSISNSVEVLPVERHDALLLLLANCFIGMVHSSLIGSHAGPELLRCSRIAREFGLSRLTRPADLTLLPSIAGMVERHSRESHKPPAGAAA